MDLTNLHAPILSIIAELNNKGTACTGDNVDELARDIMSRLNITDPAYQKQIAACIRPIFTDFDPKRPETKAMTKLMTDPAAFNTWVDESFGKDERDLEGFVKEAARRGRRDAMAARKASGEQRRRSFDDHEL